MIRSFSLLVIYVVTTIGQASGITSQSPFCNLIGGKGKPCSSELGAGCDVVQIRHEDDCRRVNFSTSIFGSQVSLHQSESFLLTDLMIKPYTFQNGNLKQVANVNISFSNIKFDSLFFRTKIECKELVYRAECWEVSVSNTFHTPPLLFWDCKWFDSSYLPCPITLEYQALKENYAESKKFSFKLPEKIDVQSHADILVAKQHLDQCVSIHWYSSHGNISTYRVKLYENENPVPDTYIINETNRLFCNELKPYSRYNVSVEGMISYQVWTKPFFSLDFNTTLSSSSDSLKIMGFICVLCVIILIFISVYFMKYYLWNRTSRSDKCLIVYHPTSIKHLSVVGAISAFFKSFITVSYFETDFNRIDNVEPADWWGKELADADLIIVVSNPTRRNKTEIPGIFTPFFETCYVTKSLSRCIPEKRVVKILLPYCEKETGFSDFLKPYGPCYHILRDRFKLLHEIFGPHNIYLPSCLASRFYSPYTKLANWRKLEKAISDYNINEKEKDIKDVQISYDDQSVESVSIIQEDSDVDEEAIMKLKSLREIENRDSSDSESD